MSDKKTPKITGIKIKIKDQEIEVTLEEARDLYLELRKIFRENPNFDTPPVTIPIPVEPYKTPPWVPDPWSPWCSYPNSCQIEGDYIQVFWGWE